MIFWQNKILKDLPLKFFHCLSNNTIIIATKNSATNNTLVRTSITAGYPWKSMPIGSTNILRSIPAINQELHFSIDIHLHVFPSTTHNNNQTTFEYLELIESSRQLPFSILKIIIEDHWTIHIYCINNTRNLVVLRVDNSLMVRTAVQSNKL